MIFRCIIFKFGKRLLIGAGIATMLWASGCSPEPETPIEPLTPIPIPSHFQNPSYPEDNQPTLERIALGKKLFFDPLLSRDRTVSCGSCHLSEHSFTDALPLSIGINKQIALRNSMPLANIAYATSLFWDGGVPTLERQVIAPIENSLEMGNTIDEVIKRLQSHSEYPALFRKAYNREPDVFSLTRAIATYERSLISGQSAYDKYISKVDTNAMLPHQKKGMQIFFSEKAECFHCHTGTLLTDFSFQNNGLYENYTDKGRYNITMKESDIGKFKVPSLRNIALTAPYMHDGSIKTLEDVIDHYRLGGRPHPNKSPLLQSIRISEEEKVYLISFLQSLTDTDFIQKHKADK